MAKLTYNESIFTNVHKLDIDGNPTGVVLASKLNQKNGQGYKLFDMIDADWNGAWIDSMHTYLNTTEDLINAINAINSTNTVSYLSEAVAWLNKQMAEVTASYVTKSYLGEVLASYQNTLIPGVGIIIDQESNIISTYNTVTDESLGYILESYLTIEKSHELYYSKLESDTLIRRYGEYIRHLIVDDAPEEFDTLHKISDWINQQMIYMPVNYEDMILDGDHQYYIKGDNNEYIPVDIDYINEHPEDQYYERINVTDLFSEIQKINDKIGYKIYDEETESYSYTGILYDIYNLYDITSIHSDNISTIISNLITIEQRMDRVISVSNIAYNMAYDAYVTSAYTLQMALESSDMAYTAYQVAVKASEDVGVPSYYGYGFYEVNTEYISYYIDNLIDLYIYNEEDNTYYKSSYHEDWNETWYAYDGLHHGTGLTGRVEDCEENIQDLTDKLNNNDERILQSLFNLHTDNEKANHVSIELTPAYYDTINKDPNRTIVLTTYNAYVNSQTGEVVNEGLIDTDVMRDIYTYLSSWIILGNDDDNSEEQD